MWDKDSGGRKLVGYEIWLKLAKVERVVAGKRRVFGSNGLISGLLWGLCGLSYYCEFSGKTALDPGCALAV
ncbi:hypothetical protein CDL15_Pgr010884 [Punica granatum]|uniref:Uncharacterized protein n=1 Tax=Punica granatum TaxID=22663 RepID=A0A218Y197_PUNGR|nr:hypothetical protein CDL15_Pgr010884 [Punica granatum]